jgi:diguanylate cyclase (GGDEF)-like protein
MSDLRLPSVSRTRTAYLIMINGRHVGKMYKIDTDKIVLGRAPDVDVKIDDEGVSRRHAIIRYEGDNLVVRDNNSTNGVFVNGTKVDGYILREGDRVQIGSNTILKFDYADEVETQAQERMWREANCDALTGAFKKRYFMEQLETEFAYHFRHLQDLSLMFFDIDHFKKLNDNYGHLAGDQALREFAGIVAEMLRTEDLFARYGGEEFVILLRDTNAENSFLIAERVRRKIEQNRFMWEGERLPVTTSVGVSTLHQQNYPDPQALVQAADEFLYRAKRGGRNRTESALME